MRFCRNFHMTILEYRRQPAAVMLQWQQMVAAEEEGYELRRRMEETRQNMKH